MTVVGNGSAAPKIAFGNRSGERKGPLEGRVAFVTGPAKGMGAAITAALARDGADLALAGRDLAAIAPVAVAVSRAGRTALTLHCDVTDAPSVADAAATAEDAFGRIDILVNVAGGTGPVGKTGMETTEAEFDEIVAVNLKGCFLTMRALLPGMTARGYGRIVNVGGTFGLRGRAGRMAYSASKWGLRGMTKSFALEAGPHGVAVNCVCPGMVEGPRFDAICDALAEAEGIPVEEARRRHAEEYALRRVSTAEDVAEAVAFLASDRARQITGQDLAVDGGWVI